MRKTFAVVTVQMVWPHNNQRIAHTIWPRRYTGVTKRCKIFKQQKEEELDSEGHLSIPREYLSVEVWDLDKIRGAKPKQPQLRLTI